MADATLEQLRVIVVVYVSAIAPLVLVPVLRAKGRLPAWVTPVYIGSFLACALGWELWFSYGWVAGDPVDLRRADVLNTMLPMQINWLLNSLADAGTVCLGGLLLAWWACGRRSEIFRRWHWGAFAVLLGWCIAQNLFVEMFLYHDQLAEGKPLSWAPFAPTGPWLNPTLFRYAGRTITLQGQLPWLIVPPILYGEVIETVKRREAAG